MLCSSCCCCCCCYLADRCSSWFCPRHLQHPAVTSLPALTAKPAALFSPWQWHPLTLSPPHSFFPFYPGITSAAPPRRCSLFFLSPLIAASSLVFRCLHCPVDPLVLFFSPPLLLCCPLSFLQSPVTSQTTRPCALTAAKMVPSASPTPPSPALQTSSSPSASSSCAALHPVRLSTLFSSFLGFYQVSAASTSQKSEAEILYVSVILTWR